jgi:hypothetical protein
VRNPLRSEDAMFRVLLWTLAVAVAIGAAVTLFRAVT